MFSPLEEHDPERVGGYPLRARIGAGGMGRVYLGFSPAGRALAIKVVRPELAEDAEFRRRFRQEVGAARRVRGAFTAELLDADTDGPTPWLATIYVPGLSLQQAVTEHGPLPGPTVWRLLAGMAEALQAIHAAGVIHRDLKPANVLLAADGPRIIDFGIARATDATPVTRTGVRVGSPQFMAPEHARGEHLTPAADVFACGALAVYAVTGETPFGEGPDAAVLYRVVNEPPGLDGVTDPRLRALAGRCLCKEPEQRPSPAEIIAECEAAEEFTTDWLPEPLLRAARERGDAIAPPAPDPGRSSLPEPTGHPKPPKAARHVRRGRSLAMPILAVSVLVVAMILAGDLGARNQSGSANPGAAPPPQTFTTDAPLPQGPITTDSSPSSTAPATSPPASQPVRTTTRHATTTARASAPAANTAITPALLGQPNFDGYCQATGQGPVQLVSDNAYGWHCSADNGTGDDAKAVCDWTFGISDTTNRVSDFYDPNSWQCWRATRELGSVNFTAYCQAIGYPSAYYVNGRDAYGWYCTNDQNALDLQDACLKLFGSSPPISRFQDFYDQNSWQCWG